MKRILTPLVILTCILFIGYAFYTFNKERNEATDPFTAVGAEASFIIRIRQFHEVNSLISDEPFASQQWAPFLNRVVSQVSAPENITSLASPQWIFIQGSDPTKLCAVIPVTNAIQDPIKICSLSSNTNKTSFETAEIFVEDNVSYSVYKGLLMISNSASLLESCILQCSKNEESQALANLRRKTAKDVAICFFGKDEYNNWTALELHPSSDGILQFTGVMQLSEVRRFSMLSASPQFDGNLILPEGALAYEVWNYDAAEEWHTIYDQFANEDNKRYWNSAWQSIGDSCSCNLNESLLEWRGSSYATMLVKLDSTVVPIAAYAMADSIDLANMMQQIATTTANGNMSFTYPYLFDRYSNHLMLTEHSFGFQYKTTFFASPSESALQFIKTKLNSENYWKQPESSNDAGIIFSGEYYLHAHLPIGLSTILEKNTTTAQFRRIDKNTIIFEWIGGETNEKTPSNLENSVNTIAPADSVIQTTLEQEEKPNTQSVDQWAVVNHNSNEKETLRQRDDLSLELISASGKTLWSIPMKDRIVGDVHQIDIYKNGKLQMAFATSKAIYILDRNGKNVGAFPLKLKEKTNAGLFVFDYDNTKTYRLIIPLSNGEVINYNTDGLPTTGWKYKGSKEITNIKIERVGNVETLVFTDINGKTIKVKRNGTPT